MRLTDRAILLAIARQSEPISQIALAEKLECDCRTVQRSIKRLFAKEYVAGSRDGRRFPYSYTVNYENLPDDIRKELGR